MKPYQVAIPSYKRPEQFFDLLDKLRSKGIEEERVTLFVHQSDSTLESYLSRVLDTECNVIINPSSGVAAQRKLISQHFPEGTPVLCMDDDLKQVIQRRPAPLNRKQLPEWDTLFTRLFQETADRGLSLWGVRSTTNIQESSVGRVTEGLRFAIGTLYGYFSRPGHPIHDTTVQVKSDYELSIRAYIYDGGLVRFDDVGADADHYDMPGGCVDWRTQEVSLESTMELMDKYPEYVKWNQTRSNATGYPEITLVNKERNYNVEV